MSDLITGNSHAKLSGVIVGNFPLISFHYRVLLFTSKEALIDSEKWLLAHFFWLRKGIWLTLTVTKHS